MRRLTIALPIAALLLGLVFANGGAAAPAGSADLKITKTDTPDPVRVGSSLTYSIGVENLGPNPASGVTVTDNLPKNVDLVSANGPAGPCAVQGGKVTCAVGALDPVGVDYGGAQVGITIVVVPRATGTIRNTATVKGDQKDPVKGNDKATASTRVLGAPTCRGVAANVSGTGGDDVLVGTAGPDAIVAFGGADRILAGSGRDLVCAGRGADYVNAGSAADLVFAGAGADRLLGRGGPDLLKGSAGNDVLKGNAGADRLRGGRGFDRCRGGVGADSVRGCER
ncbi:MAG TPA: hypothetical protein VFN92_08690 [Solirubrobacterales bacterium]|nr:hypothetical protein [Solirubrobacterales bacterium]